MRFLQHFFFSYEHLLQGNGLPFSTAYSLNRQLDFSLTDNTRADSNL